MMRVCEVCGSEEDVIREGNEVTRTRMLHLCDNCRTDHQITNFENEELQ